MDEGAFSLPPSPSADATHVEIDDATLDALLDGISITPKGGPVRVPSVRGRRRVH